MDLGNVPLYGFFHEPALDETTVKDFKEYFRGDVYLDTEVRIMSIDRCE